MNSVITLNTHVCLCKSTKIEDRQREKGRNEERKGGSEDVFSSPSSWPQCVKCQRAVSGRDLFQEAM